MDITVIQEVRWTSSGSLKTHGKTSLYSSSDKHECEVGFVIRDNIIPNIVRFKPISNRLCYKELKCKWYNIFLINCYTPTDENSDDIKKKILRRSGPVMPVDLYRVTNQK
jgi:hypothetical protein